MFEVSRLCYYASGIRHHRFENDRGYIITLGTIALRPLNDLATVGKAIGNGYAVAALVGRPDLMSAVRRRTSCALGYL
ncbi:hypothetical protein [Sinorhizobium meliloti]|uniref:hypothetical protein n=1 Tax=Rhizobium meliloti TaxID=382 RepID=UPI0001E4AC9C|nr:hypothetical protein [Sinorhizobium meliloti]MDE4586737.1 hypothetical protein [Sinorhizobium meliloti]SEJ85598.1 hypothetical protein SAMN04244575_06605 [Sinorhizobium meliloti]